MTGTLTLTRWSGLAVVLGNGDVDESSAVGSASRFAGNPGGAFDDNGRLKFDVPKFSTCGANVIVDMAALCFDTLCLVWGDFIK